MKRVWIIWLATAGLCWGQSERNRLVFPPGAAEPLATPKPTPASIGAASTPPTNSPARPPEEAVELFFLAMQSGKTAEAYDSVVRGTIIADRPEDVAALKERTDLALDKYGPIRGYETISRLAVGERLLRLTCLSLNSDLPLRWRFYFYRGTDVWRLVDLRIDDGLAELFEEESRRQK